MWFISIKLHVHAACQSVLQAHVQAACSGQCCMFMSPCLKKDFRVNPSGRGCPMKKGGGCLIDFISDKCFPGTGRVGEGRPVKGIGRYMKNSYGFEMFCYKLARLK